MNKRELASQVARSFTAISLRSDAGSMLLPRIFLVPDMADRALAGLLTATGEVVLDDEEDNKL